MHLGKPRHGILFFSRIAVITSYLAVSPHMLEQWFMYTSAQRLQGFFLTSQLAYCNYISDTDSENCKNETRRVCPLPSQCYTLITTTKRMNVVHNCYCICTGQEGEGLWRRLTNYKKKHDVNSASRQAS